MKSTREMLTELGACKEGVEWASGKSFDEIWDTCENPLWLIWLGSRLGVQLDIHALAREFFVDITESGKFGALTFAHRVGEEILDRGGSPAVLLAYVKAATKVDRLREAFNVYAYQ